MAAMRGPRLQVGSAAWVAEERSSALQIIDTEVEEFTYSARNEVDWLNEHMAGIFDENETNFAETFKTPGKLRGKTPRTARRPVVAESRIPLSDVFSATPNVPSSQFSQHLNRVKSPQILRDTAPNSPEILRSPSPRKAVASPRPKQPGPDTQDSGYYGSQDMVNGGQSQSFREILGAVHTPMIGHVALQSTTNVPVRLSPSRISPAESPEKTFQTAKEEQTTRTLTQQVGETGQVDANQATSSALSAHESSPMQHFADQEATQQTTQAQHDVGDEDSHLDGENSASEASSPIRPMVRKSSLNFASLPAREPITAVKANGGRVSRVSHLDHHRMSYYSRPTGGKSLGNIGVDDHEAEDDEEMATDSQATGATQTKYEDLAANHHKTYTQRLQDQISMLGKSQTHNERQSKSVSDGTAANKLLNNTAQAAQLPKSPSPMPTTFKSTPGAFPEDDDDWIEPPTVPQDLGQVASPRPALPKSHSADIMEGLHSTAVAGESLQALASPQRQTVHEPQFPSSDLQENLVAAPAPASPSIRMQTVPLHKAATLSDLRSGVSSMLAAPEAAQKSPTRSYRDSPLKHVKNKLSSILKGSKVLIASGAALSAEGKSSILSPSMTRLGHISGPSMESLLERPEATSKIPDHESALRVGESSPTRPVGKRTRASTEREKEEKKRDKETKRMEEQYEKLEKARAKEREKARDFSKEKEVSDKPAPGSWKDVPQAQKTPKPTRTSPRKPKGTDEGALPGADVEMTEAPSTIPQPPPRSVGPASALRNRELKRPMKPVKETLTKSRQAPTVIRVNTGSQHPQYLTSTNAQSAASSELEASTPVAQPPPQLASKASKASLQSKPSTQSLRAAAAASGRSKALDAAAKKKEQDEREAQRRREAKAELERKRLMAQEEQRKAEQLKRQEAERQKQREREQAAQAEAKKNAQRQAAIEKAKQTRAPPPAVRNHGLQDSMSQDHRASALGGRPIAAHAAKPGIKRALPAQPSEESYQSGSSRAGPSYQANDAKRRRTSEAFDQPEAHNPPNIKGPPVRPSGGFKKDIPAKPGFPTSYSNAPQSATRDLFKSTVTAQHHGQVKSAHPLDMAQIAKGAIPFAPHASTATGHPTKTPIRTTALNGMKASAAKSTVKASPKFQNGEEIELAEIQTDDEDDDEDDGGRGMVAAWADSPALRRALLEQETQDPAQIFGPPAALDMEAVFNKSKDKFHKFRSRTSSANWTGADRLTEDDIRKDLAARDKLRREGGWSYEMSRNLL
ncbi:inner centromere protein, ARK binding region domain-containing protein [Sarocladium implicatum]|nr:inner centromere protein, ARK binding region domain-containing protein [Sarocladium implicatum]